MIMRPTRSPSAELREALLERLRSRHEQLALKAEMKLSRPRRPTLADVEEVARALGYQLVPKQREILSSPKSILVVQAGRRAGKSFLAALLATTTLLKAPGANVFVVAPSRSQAADNIFARILDMVDELAPQYGVEWTMRDTYGLRGRLSNGSLLIAGSDHAYLDRFRGWPIDLAIMDEATWCYPETWHEVLRPALTERHGRALLISTPLTGSWFVNVYKRAYERALREAYLRGLDAEEGERWVKENLDWAFFNFPSWENTALFPGGINDPQIIQARRDSPDPFVFLQEYAAIPVPAREQVYREFRFDVHVKKVTWDEKRPVYLAIDPAPHNVYAVLMIQDLGEVVHVCEEFAQRGVLTEEVIETLSRRPWWPYVEAAVIDPDAEETRRKWNNHPLVHFPVRSFKKPKIGPRIELVRSWLRDPWHFSKVMERARTEVMKELGWTRSWEELSPNDKMEVETYALERVSTEELREVARLFVNISCTRLIEEFTMQRYRRPRMQEMNLPPQPQDAYNDCTDALGYWMWVYKRWKYVEWAQEYEERTEEERLTPGQWLRRYLYGEPLKEGVVSV